MDRPELFIVVMFSSVSGYRVRSLSVRAVIDVLDIPLNITVTELPKRTTEGRVAITPEKPTE
jgi:hypothetical protein